MFRRCPFNDICTPTDKIIYGNKEYHCLGTTNYDYCQKYKNMIVYQQQLLFSDPLEELNNTIREMYRKLHHKIDGEINLAILDEKGRIIYCDYGSLENQVDFLKNFTINNFQDISIGNYSLKKSDGNFGFYRISSKTLVVVNLINDDIEDFESLKSFFSEYATKIDGITERIEESQKAILEKENTTMSFFTVVCNLRTKLDEDVPALEIANELDNAFRSISQIYAWHPIIFEINDFSVKLKKYKKNELLTTNDKKDLDSKIKEWQKKIQIS